MIANLLSIAGSDPSGGAGIQADLKTFSALGTYGCAVLTALTAQNTRAVTGVELVPPAFVAAQIDTLFADVRIDAVKIGMVATAEIARVVADRLRAHTPPWIVVDPVMVAKSGDRLLAADAVAVVREALLPLASVVTPNLPEASVLTGRPEPDTRDAMPELARAVLALGPRHVLLKGGHLGGDSSPDLLVSADTVTWLEAPRIATRHTHGTGCTLSAAIAAHLPQHGAVLPAVRAAKAWLHRAIAAADRLEVGRGQGPVHHFHALWSETVG